MSVGHRPDRRLKLPRYGHIDDIDIGAETVLPPQRQRRAADDEQLVHGVAGEQFVKFAEQIKQLAAAQAGRMLGVAQRRSRSSLSK